MSDNKEFVSIITVNYNGRRYLTNFLESIRNLDYPQDKYEVVFVDNGSRDDSVDFVRKNYPEVKVIDNKRNLGFGGGNNIGIKNAKGNLYFLLNNDTALERNTLDNIVNCYKKWSRKIKVGAVNAKLVLFDSYLPIEIEEAFFSSYQVPEKARPENDHVFIITHETSREYTEKVYAPIKYNYDGSLSIVIRVKKFRKPQCKVRIGTHEFEMIHKKGTERTIVKLKLLPADFVNSKLNLFQNTGSYYFRDGFSRDRGAMVIRHRQYYEEDRKQYDVEEAVPGFCGAGVLLNKKSLADVGVFDDRFFMYYEDSDLSFRFREKGWVVIYDPKAVVRHIHAASSTEWSKFFIEKLEFGRLLFIAKHWPRFIAIKEYIKYITISLLGKSIYYILKMERNMSFRNLIVRGKVVFSVTFLFLLSLFRIDRLKDNEVKSLL